MSASATATWRARRGSALEDLNAMFGDPGVAGIFCIRGGYGSAQMLEGLDYDLIQRNPKVFLGYSDITALHHRHRQKDRPGYVPRASIAQPFDRMVAKPSA